MDKRQLAIANPQHRFLARAGHGLTLGFLATIALAAQCYGTSAEADDKAPPPTAPPCSTQNYTETTNIGGLAAVCDVIVDCFGNVTRTCIANLLMPSAHAENEGWFMADRWPDATQQFKYGFVRAAADMSLQTKMSCPRFSMATLIAQTDSVIDKWGPQAKQRFMIEAVVIAMSELGCKRKP